jgi:hypothetical protein
MAKSTKSSMIPEQLVINKIHLLRGQKVMIDEDLAELYGVETKRLKEAVRRNINRFPKDFMFELDFAEFKSLRTQFATLKKGRGQHAKYMPFAFTEQGVAMLSSVLNSETAIRVNIQIIRIFTRMREVMLTNKDILFQLEKLETKYSKHDEDIQQIFKYLKQLLTPPKHPPRAKIGFRRNNEE